jgi:F-type H+-transporting ATPase subunit epsilon
MADPEKTEAILSGKSHLTPDGTVRGGVDRLQCIVVTPERAVLDESADFVALPMFDGELGVLPGRAPLIGRLGYGELRVRIGEHTQHFYVDGGFAQVRANTVTVLTAKAFPASEISAAAAQQALQEALKPATGEALEFALKQQARARAQLHLAKGGTGGTSERH